MSEPVRVMIERGKKKRVVAVAFEWPGWDHSAKTEEDALQVLETYRPRYARVAERAGQGRAFAAAGGLDVVERVEGIGMTDYYGLSGRIAAAEREQMTAAECERRVALLEAAWATLDDAAARAPAELRKGPRGGGRERDEIPRHVSGTEIYEYGKKVGVRMPLEARDDPEALRAFRAAFVDGMRDANRKGAAAGQFWTVQFLIRRCCWHALDHAWEIEDRS